MYSYINLGPFKKIFINKKKVCMDSIECYLAGDESYQVLLTSDESYLVKAEGLIINSLSQCSGCNKSNWIVIWPWNIKCYLNHYQQWSS